MFHIEVSWFRLILTSVLQHSEQVNSRVSGYIL